MSYSIKYGEPPHTKTVTGLTTKEVVNKAYELIDQGMREREFRIFYDDGDRVELPQLELDLHSISVRSV